MQNQRKFYIDGQWVDPHSQQVAEVINPATEAVNGTIALGDQADVDTAVAAAYVTHLFPHASLITPNPAEAGLLLGLDVRCLRDGETAVRRLHDLGPQAVLLKRIPTGKTFVDLFYDGQTLTRLPAP